MEATRCRIAAVVGAGISIVATNIRSNAGAVGADIPTRTRIPIITGGCVRGVNAAYHEMAGVSGAGVFIITRGRSIHTTCVGVTRIGGTGVSIVTS